MIDSILPLGSEPPLSDDTVRSAKQIRMKTELSEDRAISAKRNDDLKRVAKDMESLFAYQLLKTMRETSQSLSGESPGQGYNTYMSLFDMEVSKIMAERGLGLQDAILKWMVRTQETVTDENNISK